MGTTVRYSLNANTTRSLNINNLNIISMEDRKKKHKQLRQEHKQMKTEEKLTGQTGGRRMAFLEQIIQAAGLNWRKLAKASGIITPQSLNWWLAADDCYLQKLQDVMAKGAGISVVPSYDGTGSNPLPLPVQKSREDYPYEIQGNLIDQNNAPGRNKQYSLAQLVELACTHPCRLTFFARRMKQLHDSGHPYSQIAEIAGHTAFSLAKIFINDNVKISTIYRLAAYDGRKVIWQVNRIQK